MSFLEEKYLIIQLKDVLTSRYLQELHSPIYNASPALSAYIIRYVMGTDLLESLADKISKLPLHYFFNKVETILTPAYILHGHINEIGQYRDKNKNDF